MKTYYFVSFMYGASEKVIQNDVIDEHPLTWQRYANKMHPNQYVLISWHEVGKQDYDNVREESDLE
jgi:hypothetical protein